MKMSISLSLVLWLLVPSFGAVCRGQTLSLPDQVLTISAPQVGARSIPTWQNGYYLTYDDGHYTPAHVFAYDRTGKEVVSAPVVIEGDTQAKVRGMAASNTGVVAVAGFAASNEPEETGFLMWISPQNRVIRIVRPHEFGPEKVAFAEDGSLWAIGGQTHAPAQRSGPHPMLQHYDSNGVLLGSMLNSTQFQLPGVTQDPSVLARLIVLPDRIAFYSPFANVWCEVTSNGTLIGKWRGLGNPNDVGVSGAGLAPDGEVYVSVGFHRAGSPDNGLYHLNKQANTWTKVDTSSWSRRPGAIMGTENGHFVLTSVGGVSLVDIR